MKRLTYLCLTTLVLTACQAKEPQTPATTTSSPATLSSVSDTTLSYQDYTAAFLPISYEELQAKMAAGDRFVLFLGRESCSYCQAFVPKLHTLLQEKSYPIYYYDTENKTDEQLQLFRTTYQITTVPNLSYFEGDQLIASLENGSQASRDEVLTLLAYLDE